MVARLLEENEERVAVMKAKIGATRLGFGCAAVPGPWSRRDALTLLETAYACGIRHFDTARMYGNGESEGVLGELVRQRREDLMLVTKAGIAPTSRLVRGMNKVAGALRMAPAPPRQGRFEPKQIRESLETSLNKLRTEHVDALLLHEIRAHEVHDGLKSVLEALRREGKIGAYGIATSVEDSEALVRAHADLCEIVQVPAGWLDRPRALPKNALLIIHSVLGARLGGFIKRLTSEEHLARAFKEDTGLTAADVADVGRLMLQAAMFHNRDGVTLFATSRPERIRRNSELLTAKPDMKAIQALERVMRAPEGRFGQETAQ